MRFFTYFAAVMLVGSVLFCGMAGADVPRLPEGVQGPAGLLAYPPFYPLAADWAPGAAPEAVQETQAQVIGDNDMLQVVTTNDYPWSAVVRLRGHYPHKTNSCSGVLIASNLVLTAAHCLYDKDRGIFADGISVYPGKTSGYSPFGKIPSLDYAVSTGYVDDAPGKSYEWDWGFVVLPKHIGFQTGWYLLDSAKDDDLSGVLVHMAGFPNSGCGGCVLNGKSMQLTFNIVGFVEPRHFLHGLDSMGGSSGSGVWVWDGGARRVVAVHTTSGDDLFPMNIATRVTADVMDAAAELAGKYGAHQHCRDYSGTDSCCSPRDPCGLAGNGVCDCQAQCPWEHQDCGEPVPDQVLCTPCAEDKDCPAPYYCGNYVDYPDIKFCVAKCADIDCPEGFYCNSKDTCWVTRGKVCRYGHVWRKNSCGLHYRLDTVCKSDERCTGGRCISLAAFCPLDANEPDGPGAGSSAVEVNSEYRVSLCPPGDVDFFSFQLVLSASVRIETWGLYGDTRLTLSDGQDQPLATDDGSGAGGFAVLEAELAPGDYFVMVEGQHEQESIPAYSFGVYTPAPCVSSCAPGQCGTDGCGGSCGGCDEAGDGCLFGQCVCAAECEQTECGPNPCGGDCGQCPGSKAQCIDGQCVCDPDCVGKTCGSDGCGGGCGECGDGQWCTGSNCECKPDCDKNECGDDGCGGVCGLCPGSNHECVAGKCVCYPECQHRECGPNGCGGSCGNCWLAQEGCVEGHCVCASSCEGRSCGDDGCGVSCGECPAGKICNSGACVVPGIGCDEMCSDVECGQIESCFCGTCPSGLYCTGGRCEECLPVCAGKACGSNGCGGECGVCDGDSVCADSQCVRHPAERSEAGGGCSAGNGHAWSNWLLLAVLMLLLKLFQAKIPHCRFPRDS